MKMTKNKDMERIIGLMESNIMGGGLMENKMAMGYSCKQIISRKKGCGKMAKK